jgi:hypothetical protein
MTSCCNESWHGDSLPFRPADLLISDYTVLYW